MLQLTLFDEKQESVIPDSIGRARVGVRPTSKALIRPSNPKMGVDFTLNPYIGCSFGCSYCFAAAFVADEHLRDRWGEWVNVKSDAAAQIARTRDLRGKRIFMSSATDPYQPLEAKIEHTRRIVEALIPHQPELVVQTRSPLVARDIDLFSKFQRIQVNMSITTDSEEIRRAFEPGCSSIERRIAALTEVSRAGIPTAVCVAPMLPIKDPKSFAERLSRTGAKHFYANYFHKKNIEFASTTRHPALKLAERMGWTKEAMEAALREIRKNLPELRPWTQDLDV